MELSEINSIGEKAGIALQDLHLVKNDVRDVTPLPTYTQSELAQMLQYTNKPISRTRLSSVMDEMEANGYVFHREERGKSNPYVLTQEDCIKVAEHLGVTKYRNRTNGKAYVAQIQQLKGGVGKSLGTSFIATAVTYLSRYILSDRRVLIIDLDPQGTSTQQFNPVVALDETKYSSITLMCDDVSREDIIEYGIVKTDYRNVDIICCGTDDGFDAAFLGSKETRGNYEPYELLQKRIIEKVERDYDLILLDAGPHLDNVMLNCLWATNLALIPIPPTFYNFDSSLRFLQRLPIVINQLVEEGMDLSKLDDLRTYLTRVPINESEADKDVYAGAASKIIEVFGYDRLIKNNLPEEKPFERCVESGRTIFTMKAKDYQGSKDAFNRASLSAEKWASEAIEMITGFHIKQGEKL